MNHNKFFWGSDELYGIIIQFLTLTVLSRTLTLIVSSGAYGNFVVSSRKPSPRIRRKIEVLPTSLLPLKATLYVGNVLFTPSAILPIFLIENHRHISEETMVMKLKAMKVLWLLSIGYITPNRISSSPWESARPQSCSSSWSEKSGIYFKVESHMCTGNIHPV